MLCGSTSLEKVAFLLAILNKLVPPESSCPKELPTLKPVYSGNYRDLTIVKGVRYIEILPKLAYFASKPYFKVLEYSAIGPKVCQETNVGRRKILKVIY